MNTTDLVYMIALSQVKGIGEISLSRILLKYGSPKDVFNHEFSPNSTWENRISSSIRNNATQDLIEDAKRVVDRLGQLGAQAYSILDEDYPLGLLQIEKAPPILYVLGQLSPTDNYGVAVVGTRQPTQSGHRKACNLGKALAINGITVLSGLALGIDTAAHEGTLEAGGRTIAVIGSGLDIRYPPSNSRLWDLIIERNGAIVSQYPPGTKPLRWNFPKRNWTMSGMAQGTVVVEASDSSGAKLQAEYAAEQKRILFLTHHQVTHFDWARQIADRNDAIVVRDVDDIIDALLPADEISQIPADLKIAHSLL